MQHRDGRHNLPQQAQGGVDIEVEVERVRDLENPRQPRPVDGVAHQGQRRAAVDPIDLAHAGVVGMPEVGQPAHPFAKGEVEARCRRQCLVQPKGLDQFGSGAVAVTLAAAEPVYEV